MQEPVDYLVIGHVTHDVQPDARITVGGTASYASLTAAALQKRVGVLTSAGPDLDVSRFDSVARLVVQPALATTTFENQYVDGSRRQIVHAVANRLTAADVPAPWCGARIVHLGPVLNECDVTLLKPFVSPLVLGLTPQGWMRARGSDKLVKYQSWALAEVFLQRATATVLSIEDLAGDWALAEHLASLAGMMVVTTGANGGVLYLQGERYVFPALAVEEVDPTGAGDIFAASFFIALAEGAAPKPAAHFAACLASLSVTRLGLASVPGPEDVAWCSICLGEVAPKVRQEIV